MTVNGEAKVGCAMILVIIMMVGVIIGPKGCDRKMQSWQSSAYGADWLVIQYTGIGDPMNYWELKNKSIGNEEGSDGIYFIDNDGNIVHLSGHYTYIQIQNNGWDNAKSKYLKPRAESGK